MVIKTPKKQGCYTFTIIKPWLIFVRVVVAGQSEIVHIALHYSKYWFLFMLYNHFTTTSVVKKKRIEMILCDKLLG